MAAHVPDDRLEIIHLQVGGEFRRGATNDARKRAKGENLEPIWVQVDARYLSPLLDELRRRRGVYSKTLVAPLTRALAAMAVDDVLTWGPVSGRALTTNRRTARKILKAPEAMWESRPAGPMGGVTITRLPDGARYSKDHNPAVDVMAAMAIDDVVTLTTVKGKMYNGLKQVARRKMGKPHAQWACTNLANGSIRCTRLT